MRNLQLWLLLALPACAGGGGDDGTDAVFVFSSFEESTFTITVVDTSNMPLQGVSVSIEDVWVELDDDSASGHSVYLSGITDANGVFAAATRVPSTVASVDVVLHDDSGRSGPWSDAAAKAALSYFAPSSRQTVAVAAAVALDVTLEDDPL